MLRLQNSVQRFNLAVQSNVSMYHFPLFPPVHLLFAFSAVLPRIVFRLVKSSAAPTPRTARPANRVADAGDATDADDASEATDVADAA